MFARSNRRTARAADAFAALAIAAFVAAPSAIAEGVHLRGAGGTFAAPLYAKWIDAFQRQNPGIGIQYDAVGSGEGIAQFVNNAVDFGGSDVPLTAEEAARVGRGAIQAPATAGMIVLAYNVPKAGPDLKLPQDVYADIFLGKIRSWDDPRIKAANPGVALPHLNIAVVVRQDSSGTTYAFTNHLAAVSKSWTAQGLGVGKLIAWPQVAMIARGNEGVASRIKISEGAIGYVEYGFAHRLGLPVALLQNKDGQFIAPTSEHGVAALAASAGTGLDALAGSMANPPGADAYPIVSYSWMLLYGSYPAERGKALVSFADYALGAGQGVAAELGYLALPSAVADMSRKALAAVQESDRRGE